jgi:guanosine-3',5'-bis(diphosphate) 3'-pyrophosphohydrolase
VRAEFGDEIARLVDGVTKLTRVQFQSREQAEAENYRKMVVAMSEDVRVILIKLADRLHNLRTIEYLGKQKQIQKAKEALEVYAPLAHRLGIHALKWELEDLSFQILHPRKYDEIKTMVAERRADREGHVAEAADQLTRELDKVDIPAEISGRAKHFYSIYE